MSGGRVTLGCGLPHDAYLMLPTPSSYEQTEACENITFPKLRLLAAASDPAGRVGEGARNMKSMWLPLVAIFFMTYLYRAGGTMVPSAPPLDPLLGGNHHNFVIHQDI